MSVGTYRNNNRDTEVVFSPPRRGRPTAFASPDQLSVTRSLASDGTLFLRFQGRLDINTVLAFRDAAFSALGERPSQLILDLSQLYVVESTGISALVTLARVAQLIGVGLDLVPSSDLDEIFTSTGLKRLMMGTSLSGDAIARKILAHA